MIRGEAIGFGLIEGTERVPRLCSLSHFRKDLRLGILALTLAAACASSGLLGQSSPEELPFSIQRVVIPPQRVAKELEKVQQGTLIGMPLQEFEDRVERARKALRVRDQKPRLLRSHYRAELIDRALSNGSGQWLFVSGAEPDAVVPLETINLAVRQLRWEHGGEALSGEFEGNGIGLLLPKQGNQTCLFDWSARGSPANEALTFRLQMPRCPLTTFDITLPADLWLSMPKGTALVSGPLEAEVPGKRLWTIQVTGQSNVEFSVRKMSDPQGRPPTIFAHVQTFQRLAPQRAQVDFEFTVDILHGSVRELILEGDAGLQPTDVIWKSGELKSWSWTEETPKKDGKAKSSTKGSGILTLAFHQPVQGKLVGLRVRALAASTQANRWTSPSLRIRDALPRGEVLKIQFDPNVNLSQWENGTFRLTDIAIESDGTQVITLADSASSPGASARPTILLDGSPSELYLKEANSWHFNPDDNTLSADWTYTSLHGNTYQLIAKLPDGALGYRVENVEVEPADLMRGHYIGNNLLIVDLKQPVSAHKKAVLKVRLRSSSRGGASVGHTMAYPELEPVNNAKREGSLAIFVDPIFHAQLLSSSVPLMPYQETRGADRVDGASYRFTYRDRGIKATVRLVPQPVQVHLRGKQTVILSDKGAAVQFAWEVEPLRGAPKYIDFFCPEALVPLLHVMPEAGSLRIHRWERLYREEMLPHLLQLGAPGILQQVLLEPMLPRGALWRFHFTERLRKKAKFTVDATLAADLDTNRWRRLALAAPNPDAWSVAGGMLASRMLARNTGSRSWSVPLMLPAQNANVELEIAVESLRAPIVGVDAAGMRVARAVPTNLASSPVHALAFHMDENAGANGGHLTFWTHPDKTSASVNELCDEAQLRTTVHADGAITHHLKFRLWHWRDHACTVRFSQAIQVMAARVEGHWLESLEAADDKNGTSVVIPVDQNVPYVRCEIFARSEVGAGHLPGVFQIAVPRIELPIEPIDFRLRFSLAPGLAPLHREEMSLVGVPTDLGNPGGPLRWLRRAWNLGQSWLPFGDSEPLVEQLEAQKQMVLRAETELRSRKAEQSLSLAQAIERLAVDHLKDSLKIPIPLVIDNVALQALSLTPNQLIGSAALSSQARRPFWESLGLIYVASPCGALLTSPARLESFALASQADFAALDAAMRESLLCGRDSSSSLAPALLWIRTAPAFPQTTSSTNDFSHTGANTDDGSDWQLHAGARGHDTIVVMDLSVGRALGWILALFAAACLWYVHRVYAPLTCLRAYLFLLAGSVIAVIWLPGSLWELGAGPLLGVEASYILWFLFTLARSWPASSSTGGSTMIRPVSHGAILGALILGVPWWSAAQAPSPRQYNVLIVALPKPTAFVPLELKLKLDELEKPTNLSLRNPVLTRANYQGLVKDQNAAFDAQYDIFSPRENASFVLPLTGIQLHEGIYLDGVPVFPTVHKSGYLLRIPGKGSHQLRLSFTARANVVGDSHDLHFNVPKLLQNEMSIQWALPVASVNASFGHGEESRLRDARQWVKEWRSQLGIEGNIHLRWSAENSGAVSKVGEVQEMHYWDLRPGMLSLSSSFDYSLGKSSLTQAGVAIPEGLHVRNVEALQGVSPAKSTTPVAIDRWQVLGKGNQRRLVVDFAQPVANHLAVRLEILPQVSLHAKQVLLSMPAPLQGKSVVGHLGYRIDAKETRSTAQNLAVQGISANDFAAMWNKVNAGGPIAADRAYSFQRKGVQAGLELAIQPVDRKARLETLWQLDPNHAELTAKCTLSSLTENIILQEFIVPANVTVARVQGSEIGRWNMRDSLLQVWFRRPCQQAEVEITGWHRISTDRQAPRGEHFLVPCLIPKNVQMTPSTLKLQPIAGMSLDPERLIRLRPAGESLQFSIDDFAYEGSFRLNLRPAAPIAESLGKIHAMEHGVEVRCHIRVLSDRGKVPALKLHVRDWPADTLVVEAPGGTVRQVKETETKQLTWAISYPPGQPYHVDLLVHGHLAKDLSSRVTLPRVVLDKIPFRAESLSWKDLEIVNPVTGKKIADDSRPALAQQGNAPSARGWKHAIWVPGLQAEIPKTTVKGPIRVLGSTAQSWLDDDRKWIHEANYWIQDPESATLRLQLPTSVARACVFIDGQLRAAQAAPSAPFLLSMPGSPEPHHLRLRWTYSPKTESFNNPRFEFPGFDRSTPSIQQHLVMVPAGLSSAGGERKSTTTLVETLLHDLTVQAREIEAFVQEQVGAKGRAPDGWLKTRQQEFYSCARLCEHAVSSLKSVEPGADVSQWETRLNALKKENGKRAREYGYDRVASLAERGRFVTPLKGLAVLNASGAGRPIVMPVFPARVAMTVSSERLFSEGRSRSELVVLIFVSLLVFSFFRHSLVLLHALVPEFLLGVTLVGIWWFGWGVCALLMLGALLSMRVVRISNLVRSRLQRGIHPDLTTAPRSSKGVRPGAEEVDLKKPPTQVE